MTDHPLLTGFDTEHLRDWRGEATLLPPRLKYTVGARYSPEVKWCGIDETRIWRCGCRGNVASVLIEKPARGDFLPVLDGGYALQYSPRSGEHTSGLQSQSNIVCRLLLAKKKRKATTPTRS